MANAEGSVFTQELEEKLKEICKKYLTDSRPGDWEHTLRTVEWVKYIMSQEGGDKDILLPAAYLHDIGWHFSLPKEMRNKNLNSVENLKTYFKGHLEYGPKMAKEILQRLNYPPDKVQRIVYIISIHDLPELVKEKEEVILMEADRLDRFGRAGLERSRKLFLAFDVKSIVKRYEMESSSWFCTETSKKVFKNLLKEMESLT
ncbi:MAG: HD domain-containing protein [Nitrososphaeria archaeon]